jgi:osmotically-inducible protein OsmY
MKTMQSRLQHDVNDELQWEPSIDSSRIGVAVDGGVVVISGHVRSLAERVATEAAVKRVRGVTAVANELEIDLPGGNVRDDAHIAKAARDALQWNVFVPEDSIKITVSNGWLSLDGEVPYAYQARKATEQVEQLTGVVGVTNRIRVRPAAPPVDVHKQLTQALHRHARIEAQNIQSEIKDGKVVLRGKVGSWAERVLVENAAWAAPGVHEVENLLEVRA